MTTEQIVFLQRHCRLRKRGYIFTEKTYNKPAQIGEIRTRNEGICGRVSRMKTENGWKYISQDKEQQFKPKPFKPMPRKKTNPNLPRQEPKPIKRTALTTEEKLTQGWQWVQIDSRTKVLRHPSKLTA